MSKVVDVGPIMSKVVDVGPTLKAVDDGPIMLEVFNDVPTLKAVDGLKQFMNMSRRTGFPSSSIEHMILLRQSEGRRNDRVVIIMAPTSCP